VTLITALRVFSECRLLDYAFETSPEQVLRFYLENIFYFLVAVYAVPALISKLTREKFSSLFSLTAKLFPIILLAPWVDRFLFGRTEGYHQAEVTRGILLQVILVISSVVVFVFFKTKNFLKSAGGGLLTYLLLWFFAMPEFIFPPALNFASDTFLQFYYFFPFLAAAAWIFWKKNPAEFLELFIRLRSPQAFFWIAFVEAGGILIYFLGYRIHGIHLFYAAWVSFFVWGVFVLGKEFRTARALFSLLAFSFAATLNFPALAMASVGISLGWLRPKLAANSIFAGIASGGALLLGVYASDYVRVSFDKTIGVAVAFAFVVGVAASVNRPR